MDIVHFSYCNSEEMERLDSLLSSLFFSHSRRQWKIFCKEGEVSVNGKPQKSGYLLKSRDTISFGNHLFPTKVNIQSFENKAQVVFEDAEILAIDKSSEIHSVMLRSSSEPSVAQWISHFYPECIKSSQNHLECGLIGRLDFYTSGLVLAAKNSSSWKALHRLQKNEGITKEYWALCEGHLSSGNFEINAHLKQSSDGKKMEIANPEEKAFSARTIVQSVMHCGENLSLVSLRGTSFRRHQLRIHMSSIGHPLCGDYKYGAKMHLLDFFKRDGFYLHSSGLSFEHPTTGKHVRLENKPDDSIISRLEML